MKKRKKLKIKNLIIVFIIILIILISIYFVIKNNSHNDNVKKDEKNSIPNIKNDTKKDENVENKDTKKLKQATYFIDENLDRYLNYIKEYPDKSVDEVIKSVNSNIDYEFYTNVTNTNLDDGKLVLVNKYTKLDENYKPNLVNMDSAYSYDGMQMNSEAYEHLKQMINEAKKDNIKLYNISSYRSYYTQSTLYNNYVNSDGKEAADRYSARAGYSEHQTGLATDLNTASSSAHFENTKEYNWLINNSYKYGFILRYPKDKEYITGYKYEPWHYRYVGIDAANYIHKHDITFEEYYAYFVKNKK